MAHFYNDDLEYVGDHYYDVVDFDNNPFGVAVDTERDSDLDSVDSDDVEDNPESTRVRSDTTASEARNGKDMQGILWERLNFSREKYRERRLMEYKNYDENLPSLSRKKLGKKCLKVEKGKLFYEFQLNTRVVESTIAHFQLRNLIWATSKHDVYLMQNYCHTSVSIEAEKQSIAQCGQANCTYSGTPRAVASTALQSANKHYGR